MAPRPPDSQQLWHPHPDGGFVQAVAVVPTIEGLPVALTDAQIAAIGQINSRLGNLLLLFKNEGGDSIFDLVEAMGLTISQSNSLVAETRLTLQAIKGLLLGDDLVSVGQRLALIRTDLADSEVLLSQILARLNQPVIESNASLNGGIAAINAVTGAANSDPIALTGRTKSLLLQPYFSVNSATASISVELRSAVGTPLLSRRWLRSSNLAATSVNLAGQFAADAVEIPAQGAKEAVIHVRSVSTGNLTIFASEVSDV
jgi:hypothetical protein